MSSLFNRRAKVALMATVALTALSGQLASALAAGDKAPDFALQASDGKTYPLSEFVGVRPVVIAFFPKAFTGG